MTISPNERQIAGRNIKALREESDVSVMDLSKQLEIDRTYFHDIENGTANATFEKYERIAAYFGVTVRDLLTDRKKRRELVRR